MYQACEMSNELRGQMSKTRFLATLEMEISLNDTFAEKVVRLANGSPNNVVRFFLVGKCFTDSIA